MRYLALATDYDGALAVNGRVELRALSALGQLRASGRRAVLVTGRQLDDLCAPVEVVAIGNDANDHGFLGLAECGVAVATAVSSLKSRATFTLARGAIGAASVAHVLDQPARAQRRAPVLDVVLPDDPRGKTMIAQNIANAAVLAGHSVLFTTAAQLLLDLGARGVSYRKREAEQSKEATETRRRKKRSSYATATACAATLPELLRASVPRATRPSRTPHRSRARAPIRPGNGSPRSGSR